MKKTERQQMAARAAEAIRKAKAGDFEDLMTLADELCHSENQRAAYVARQVVADIDAAAMGYDAWGQIQKDLNMIIWVIL